MSYIVKAGHVCTDQACRRCERYITGFFSRDGGITVVRDEEIELAEFARFDCPKQIIEISRYEGDKC